MIEQSIPCIRRAWKGNAFRSAVVFRLSCSDRTHRADNRGDSWHWPAAVSKPSAFDTSRKTCFGWSHSKSFQTVLNASMSAAFRVSALVTPDDSKVELVFTVQASGRGGIEARTIKVACERESMKSMTCFAVSV